jgi:hypothetical protein
LRATVGCNGPGFLWQRLERTLPHVEEEDAVALEADPAGQPVESAGPPVTGWHGSSGLR